MHRAKYIVAAVLFIAAAFLVLDNINTKASAAASLAATDAPDASASNSISLVDKLRAIKLDKTFLTNPVFLSLRENAVSRPTMQSGRSNPFAPLAGAAPASTQNR